jgi:hypothetical protein
MKTMKLIWVIMRIEIIKNIEINEILKVIENAGWDEVL